MASPELRSQRPSGAPRMRVLIALSSSNQMYSGIGRAVFAFVETLAPQMDFELAIDDLNPRNRDLVVQFGQRHGLPVHLGRGHHADPALDNGNRDLPALIALGGWDVIEAVCFANAATNAAILEAIDDGVTLAYTPHDQPNWTVPMAPHQAMHLQAVHQRMLERADLVLCDSPHERDQLQDRVPGRNHCVWVPLGCDFERFRAGGTDRPDQLLFVGDLAEPRKRFDRVLSVMERLIRLRPSARLVVIGNRSESTRAQIPESVRHAIELRGYVSEAELLSTYARSAGLMLLSDFEAFGVPILESLACGTPVFLSEQAETRSLFGDFAGARFVPADDPDTVAHQIAEALQHRTHVIKATRADRPRLESQFSWERAAYLKQRALSAAWFGRRCWAVPA